MFGKLNLASVEQTENLESEVKQLQTQQKAYHLTQQQQIEKLTDLSRQVRHWEKKQYRIELE